MRQSGYRIALHYHNSESEAKSALHEFRDWDIDCEAIQADVSNESDVDSMFHQLGERFGRLDVLVTTASVWQPKKLEELTAEDVRFNFDVNTLGTFLCVRRGGLMMVGQDSGGSIVTIGDWSIQRPYSDHAAYFVAKGASPDADACHVGGIGDAKPEGARQLHPPRARDGAARTGCRRAASASRSDAGQAS